MKRLTSYLTRLCPFFVLCCATVCFLPAQDGGGAFYQMKPATTFTLTTYSPEDKVLTPATHVLGTIRYII